MHPELKGSIGFLTKQSMMMLLQVPMVIANTDMSNTNIKQVTKFVFALVIIGVEQILLLLPA